VLLKDRWKLGILMPAKGAAQQKDLWKQKASAKKTGLGH
jgi:hypothetical protein